jgi:beta-galactosidase
MRAATHVGRVGGLAVALGVGAAVVSGYGTAWADDGSTSPGTPSSGSSSSSGATGTTAGSTRGPSTAPAKKPQSTSGKTPTAPGTTDQAPPGVVVSTGGAVGSTTPRSSAPTSIGPPSAFPLTSRTSSKSKPAPAPEAPVTTLSGQASVAQAKSQSPVAQQVSIASVATQAASTGAPDQATVPTLFRPWPTAFDPGTAVSYVTGLVTSFISQTFSPFSSGAPAAPVDPASWTMLAFARRELFNGTPTINYNPAMNTQTSTGQVLGDLNAEDPDGDPLTYSVIGRPLNGGTVVIDQATGKFTYTPTKAMAAVGGSDQFTVVASDAGDGFKLHGIAGLIGLVPIVGNLLSPGGGSAVSATIKVSVTPVAGVDLSFPDDFRWGVASAGFQSDMGTGVLLDENSDWWSWTHDAYNQALGLTKGLPENGPGEWDLYKTDAELASQGVGADTFRVGIEWSRIFPDSTASVDTSHGFTVDTLEQLDALADQGSVWHYQQEFDALRAAGLDPLVTINHFTLPTWINDPTTNRPLIQAGLPVEAAGWLSPETTTEFEKYAAYVAWKFGDQVDNWVVLNEPVPPTLTGYFAAPILNFIIPYWPPGVFRPDLVSTFLVNEANAYVAAYRQIHTWDTTVADPRNPAAFVGFANNMIPVRPANPINPLDVAAAAAWGNYWNNWFPNAVMKGEVDANLDGIIQADEVHPEMADSADFYGVNYYGPQTMTGIGFSFLPGFPPLQGIPGMPCPPCSDYGTPIDAGGFREVLDLAATFGKPIWITENGIADASDTQRASYIVSHLAVVQDEIANGMDIMGYTYWTLTDNLEWASGYEPKFGLYSFDPTTLVRTPRPSVEVVHEITTGNALPIDFLRQPSVS